MLTVVSETHSKEKVHKKKTLLSLPHVPVRLAPCLSSCGNNCILHEQGGKKTEMVFLKSLLAIID